jgi:iron(III) transport system ATP-binding protein
MVKVTSLLKWFRGERGSEVRAVDGINFEVTEGRFFTLLGPSGCGKTTTLRCLAGLEKPDDGVIWIGERVVSSARDGIFVPPHQRGIGMVFQSYAIWPHMTVFDNVAFPLQVGKRHFSREQIRQKVEKALATVQLDSLEDRPAPHLSGGQQQRLALARALVGEPKLLLLDEPLSNLDAKLREQMRIELRELQRRLGITTIYVTHDQAEALAMSNLLAVMNDGQIVQVGKPRDIYQRPNGAFVAGFIGSTNLIPGHAVQSGAAGEPSRVETAYGSLACYVSPRVRPTDELLVSVRPENLVVHKMAPTDEANVFRGQVQVAVFLGDYVDCQIQVGEHTLRARLHPTQRLHRGEEVYVELPCEHCTVIAEEK